MMPAIRTLDPTPRHGDRGDARTSSPRFPRTLTITVSRQSGSRGGSIARRVGRKLGWQVVDQELMEYVAQKGGADDELTTAARDWAEHRLFELQESGQLGSDAHAVQLARVILTLGATGEVVLIGRGAGHILPAASTLNVRVVAPRADRIAYFSQWMRLTPAESEHQVDARDVRRGQYLLDQFGVDANDPIHYDLVVNSSLLGEELSAEVITQAARAKLLGEDAAEANGLDPV